MSELFVPTRIITEKDCITKHGDLLKNYGDKAMIVTGKSSSKKNGSLQAVITQLEKNKTAYYVFDEIEENPSIETVMKAREIGLKENVTFVIGIGGGSPMDAAKAIALMIANPTQGEEVLYQQIELPYLPVVEVPTTAGTGSEVTPWAILTIHKKRTKSSISHKIYPALALVDTTYLKAAPYSILASTAVDTLCHLVESHLVTKATVYSRCFSGYGLQLWGKMKNHLLADKMTDEDYDAMMQACLFGGMAISHTGTGVPHALSYRITYEEGMAHGFACGMTLAGFVKYYPDDVKREEVLRALEFCTIAEFEEYMHAILPVYSISNDLIEDNIDKLLQTPGKLATYPEVVKKEILEKYYAN